MPSISFNSSTNRLSNSMFLIGVGVLIGSPAKAQIIPDDSLGAERSRVEVIDGLTDRIGQGAIRGENLFHSFQEFNVDEGRRAYFANPDGIRNILSRVTGDDVSDIFGTLGVEGDANLFFLNPNGIVFGPNAQLDVAGSFVASTADRFSFDDGHSFSATEPDAPPLLTVNVTPGLQMGAGQGPIINDAQLLAGQDLVLDGSVLDLEGWLAAGGNLLLQGDQVQVRDSVDAPFVAEAGGSLTVTGNTIDIFALNHVDSGLVSGGDMVLRSSSPVIGDAHYWSGGGFRIETPDGGLGGMESPNDPVIRVAGDVAFDSYTGASLHIFAGGSVTIPGDIEITGADPVNGLVEMVVLSDGSVVEIDGQSQPTLDIRAGTMAVPDGGGATGANIQIGNIRNEGGTVFLTNQYQSNLDLDIGDIQAGEIDTSVAEEVLEAEDGRLQSQISGGNVVVDGRRHIELTGDVNTSAEALVELVLPRRTENSVIGNILMESKGGAIHLISEGAIKTQNLTSSATAIFSLQSELTDRSANHFDPIIISGDVSGRQVNDISIRALGGDILFKNQEAILTGNLNTDVVVDVNVYAFIRRSPSSNMLAFVNGNTKGDQISDTYADAIAGNITLNTTESVLTENLNSSADIDMRIITDTFVSPSGSNIGAFVTGNVLGSVVDNTTSRSAGGNIVFKTQDSITTGDLNTGARSASYVGGGTGSGSRAYDFLDNTYASFTGSLTGSKVGDLNVITTGGAIIFDTQESIITNNISTRASSLAWAEAFALVSTNADKTFVAGDIAGGEISNITVDTVGGSISFNTQSSVMTGDIVTATNASAYFYGRGSIYTGQSISGSISGGKIKDITITSSGGSATFNTDESIILNNLDVGASSNVKVNATALGSTWRNSNATLSGSVLGGEVGNISLFSNGGNLTFNSQDSISTADLRTRAVARLTGRSDILAASTFAHGPSVVGDMIGGTIGDVTFLANGGAINFQTPQTITTSNLDTSAYIYTRHISGSVITDNGASIQGNVTGGSLGDINFTSIGGAISFDTQESIITGNLSTNAFASSNLSLDTDTSVSSQLADGSMGNITFTSIGGSIVSNSKLTTTVRNLNTSAEIFVSADVDEMSNLSDVILYSAGGAINASSEGSIVTDNLTTTASTDLSGSILTNFASREPDNIDITALGGLINLSSEFGDIALSEGSWIRSNVLNGDGNGGDIQLSGQSLQLNNNLLTTTVSGSGNAGNITINIIEDVAIDRSRLISGRESISLGSGSGGKIEINAGSVELKNFAFLNTATFGTGNAGDVLLTTTQGDISLDNSSIFSLTAGDGSAGSISIESAGSLHIVGESVINTTVALGVPKLEEFELTGDIIINAVNGIKIIGNGIAEQGTQVGTNPILEPRIDNDAFDSAQPIDPFFSVAKNPDVLFPTEIPYVAIAANNHFDCQYDCSSPQSTSDYYSVNVTSVGTQITFDIDNTETDLSGGLLDVDLYLYDSNGDVLASNVRAPTVLGAGGSRTPNDAFFSYIFNEPGTYVVGAEVKLIPESNIPFEAQSDYTLNISRVDDFLVSSGITTQTRASNPSGNITVNTPIIDIQNGGQISTETSRDGLAGNILLQPFADGSHVTIDIQGKGSQISGSTNGPGDSGTLTIQTPGAITLQGDGSLAIETNGLGNAGKLKINTGILHIQDDITLSAQSNSNATGDAGEITINATDSVTFSDNSQLSVETNGSGTAGNVSVSTPLLTVTSNAAITATATKTATPISQGGNISLSSNIMYLAGQVGVFSETQGEAPAGSLVIKPYQDNPNLDITLQSVGIERTARLSTSTLASGQGGNLTIGSLESESIVIRGNGQISAETRGDGNAGTLHVITQNLTLDENVQLSATSDGGGTAGGIKFDVDRLTLQDGAEVSVRSDGTASAGDLHINADSVLLTNAALIADTEAGKGGDINLQIDDQLVLTEQSQISASTQSGQGGSIRLNQVDIVDIQNSQIAATAQETTGTAGAIDIQASDTILFSGQFNPNQRGGVSVSAEGGTEGSVTITTSDLTLANETEISVRNAASGKAGNLSITADNLTLQGDSILNAETDAGQGGNIHLHINDALRLSGGSEIVAKTQSGTGGRIDIEEADTIEVQNSSISATAETPTGTAGTITVEASESVVLGGRLNGDDRAGISVSAVGNRAGALTLTTSDLTIHNGAELAVSNQASGNAGALSVVADNVMLNQDGRINAETEAGVGGNVQLRINDTLRLQNGSEISTSTESGIGGNIRVAEASNIYLGNSTISSSAETGKAGELTINASEQLVLSGDRPSGEAGGLLVESSHGEGGNLMVQTNQLVVENGAAISVATNRGVAGDVTVIANDSIRLSGEGTEISAQAHQIGGIAGNIMVNTNELTMRGETAIIAANKNASEGGNIQLMGLDILDLNNSRIDATTSTGEAGEISIAATDVVHLHNGAVLSVETASSQNTNAISASGRSTARTRNRTFTPSAGNLSIETDRLMVTDGSSIFIRSLNGQAGNIDITANQVELDTGEIRATTRENPASDQDSANINIIGLEWLTLDNDSLLSAEALPGANGGNIFLDAEGGIILATPYSNSDIVATAVDGNGGRIEITALQVLGLQENPGSFSQLRDNQTNDISATSITGADGDVVVDSDPFQVEVDVPVDTTPPPLDQGCRDSTASQGHFVNRERGGIPLNPDDPISSDLAWEDLYPPNSVTQSTSTTEANRWHINEEGQIVLRTPQEPQASPFTCHS